MSQDLTFEAILKHIDRESEHFVIRLEKHHHSGREATIIQPHRPTSDDALLRELSRQLKEALGTSGDVESGQIVLHGDLRNQVADQLAKLGYNQENIEII